MKWPCDFQNNEPANSWLCFAEEPESEKFEVELFHFDMLFIKKFYIKKVHFILVKQNYIGNSLYKFLPVQFEKSHNCHSWKVQLIDLKILTNVFFKNWCRESLMLLDFDHPRRVSKKAWKCGKALKSASFEICKSIMAPKWLTYHIVPLAISHNLFLEFWLVDTFTTARTKMEVGKSRTRVGQWWSWSHEWMNEWNLYLFSENRINIITKLKF